MKEINVSGKKRQDLGKKASKQLRKEGYVPCNIYGAAQADGKPEALAFAAPMSELRKKPITIGIPVKLVGLAQGVRDGGRMNLSIRKVNVTAPYQRIPEHLDIDVTNLKIGKSIKVGQLNFEGLEMATSKDVVVCSIKMTCR